MKKWMITLAVMVLTVGRIWATSMQSDDFSGSTIDAQWSKAANNFTWSQANNALSIDMPASGNPINTTIGITSTTGYTIGGDFDFKVTLDWMNTSGYNISTRVAFVVSGQYYCMLDHVFASASSRYETATTVVAGVSTNQTASGLSYNDQEVRMARVGDVFSIYGRAMDSDTWVLRKSVSGFSTGDGTITIGGRVPASNTSLDINVKDFQVPEPVSTSLLVFGGMMTLLTRRRRISC